MDEGGAGTVSGEGLSSVRATGGSDSRFGNILEVGGLATSKVGSTAEFVDLKEVIPES